MEQLQAVYNTFVNLEKNYARSKKTREEYLTEKLGGDVVVGSFLILHALSKLDVREPKEIEMLSYVRTFLDHVRKNKDNLAGLTSFDFSDDSEVNVIFDTLSAAEKAGTKIEVKTQQAFAKETKRGVNCCATVKGITLVPLNSARYLRLFTDWLVSTVSDAGVRDLNFGDLVEVKLGNRISKVKTLPYWEKYE